MKDPLIIAHRGDSTRAPENSLEAFQFALSVPADMIEFDLRMSRDKVLYVMHDRKTGRTADRDIDIEHSSSQEIARIKLLNDQPVPTLDDVLKLVAGKAGLNIEIKSDGAGSVLSAFLLHSSYKGSITLTSFKEAEIRSVRSALRSIAVGAIYDTFSARLVDAYKSKGYDIISLRKNTVTEPLVRACRAAAVRVFVWTVNDAEEMKRCIEWNVDGIYTDNPRLLKEVIGKTRLKNIR